jgi:hypothetical protein
MLSIRGISMVAATIPRKKKVISIFISCSLSLNKSILLGLICQEFVLPLGLISLIHHLAVILRPISADQLVQVRGRRSHD